MIYRAIPRSWDDSEGELSRIDKPRTIEVFEAGDPQPTGLVDEHGVPIYRVTERVSFGFPRGSC